MAASYLTVSGVIVDVRPEQAAALAGRIDRDALGVRKAVDEIRTWLAR
ncbi:hypothetical protein [Streptomyces sp. NPDC047070]